VCEDAPAGFLTFPARVRKSPRKIGPGGRYSVSGLCLCVAQPSRLCFWNANTGGDACATRNSQARGTHVLSSGERIPGIRRPYGRNH
jgi:hypothetical protein